MLFLRCSFCLVLVGCDFLSVSVSQVSSLLSLFSRLLSSLSLSLSSLSLSCGSLFSRLSSSLSLAGKRNRVLDARGSWLFFCLSSCLSFCLSFLSILCCFDIFVFAVCRCDWVQGQTFKKKLQRFGRDAEGSVLCFFLASVLSFGFHVLFFSYISSFFFFLFFFQISFCSFCFLLLLMLVLVSLVSFLYFMFSLSFTSLGYFGYDLTLQYTNEFFSSFLSRFSIFRFLISYCPFVVGLLGRL